MISVYGSAENGTLPPLETNHVIFLMSTSFVPIMISCNSFPVLEGRVVPLAMYLRGKKVPSSGCWYRTLRESSSHWSSRHLIYHFQCSFHNHWQDDLSSQTSLRCSGFSFVNIPYHGCLICSMKHCILLSSNSALLKCWRHKLNRTKRFEEIRHKCLLVRFPVNSFSSRSPRAASLLSTFFIDILVFSLSSKMEQEEMFIVF